MRIRTAFMNRTHLPPHAAADKASTRAKSPALNRRAMLSTLAVLALTLVVTVVSPITPSSAQSCLSASQTRQAISNGDVISLSRVTSAVRARGYSEVSSANVCQSGGRYVYTVIASTSSGASARITVDGATGSILSEQ